MITKGQFISIILLLYLLASGHPIFGAIVINNVSTTPSTCANNGSITVDATSSPDPFLLYRIVAGPVTTPMQNGNTFNSLFPGTYTIRLYDVDFDSTETQATVLGSYTLPDYSPIISDPTCLNSNDGMIIGNPDLTKGNDPFTWEILSPISIGPQVSDTFSGLAAGTYQMRMTDSCSNYQTRTVVLVDQGTSISPTGQARVTVIGCDTSVISFYLELDVIDAQIPITLSVEADQGGTLTTYTTQRPPTLHDYIRPAYVRGVYYISDTIAGLTFGSFSKVWITDVCGDTIQAATIQALPFDFTSSFSVASSGCIRQMHGAYSFDYINGQPYHLTYANTDLNITVTNLNTSTIEYNYTYVNRPVASIGIGTYQAGETYEIMISDRCGNIFRDTIIWPSPPPLSPCNNPLRNLGCNDSTSTVFFNCPSYSAPTTITINGSNTVIQSTKPGFEHSGSISFPFTYTEPNYSAMTIRDFPMGSYTYTISDTCGNTHTGNFNITSNNIAKLAFDYTVRQGCAGQNTLLFDMPYGTDLVVTNTSQDTLYDFKNVYPFVYSDSINSLSYGTYFVEMYVYVGENAISLAGYTDCTTYYDTITISPNLNNALRSVTEYYCNGSTYLTAIVDSNVGVPPYQFEIISGPQTFPLQSSNEFVVDQFGTYIIRLRDDCANTDVIEVTIDTDTIPEVVKTGIACVGSRVVLSSTESVYFGYEWARPNGRFEYDHELIMDPFRASDTGTYVLTKYVFINGCVDTFTANYHLSLNDSFPQTVNICLGDTLFVGNSFYTTTGIYRDTLTSLTGCDSVIISDLRVLDNVPLVIDTNLCGGQQLEVNGRTYTNAGTYYDTLFVDTSCFQPMVINISTGSGSSNIDITICQGDVFYVGNSQYSVSGSYVDTISTGGSCDSIVYTNLTVSDPDTSQVITTCYGDTIRVGNSIYVNTAGSFWDTLTSQLGCDSVVHTHIALLPYFITINDTTICYGEFVTVGNNVYNNTGWYRDTIYDASGCMSILRTNLTVLNIVDTIATQICLGDTLFVGNNAYASSGTYIDKFTNFIGCDSTVVTELSVISSSPTIQSLAVCQGTVVTVGSSTYTAEGTYYDTLTSIFSCDSVVITTISWVDVVRDTINADLCPDETITIAQQTYSTTGIYYDTLQNNNCDSILTIIIDQLPAIDVEATADTTIVTPNQPIQLNAVANGILTYYWASSAELSDPNIQSPTGYISQPSWFTVTVTDPSTECTAADSVFIDLLPDSDCSDDRLFIPNAFTPNGDGRNDYLEIFVDCPLKEFELKIFNRWGEKVFHSQSVDHKWDGRHKGEIQRPDVFVFYIQAVANNGKKIFKKGSVALVR